jgi:hypothetical protein
MKFSQMAESFNSTIAPESEASRKRRRAVCLLATVAALALSGSALAQDIGPPPPPPVYNCAPPPWIWNQAAYCNGYAQGFQIAMQRWRARLDYWRALHDYRMGGN